MSPLHGLPTPKSPQQKYKRPRVLYPWPLGFISGDETFYTFLGLVVLQALTQHTDDLLHAGHAVQGLALAVVEQGQHAVLAGDVEHRERALFAVDHVLDRAGDF